MDRGSKLIHKSLWNDLEYTVRLPLKNIIRQADAIRFYDDRPPSVYTMSEIWRYVASVKITEQEFRNRKKSATIHVDINIDELLEGMRSRFAPSNNPTIIKRVWITEALEEFVNLGLAKKSADNYEIHIKRPRNPRDFILDLLFETKQKEEGQVTIDEYINKDNSVYPS